MATLLLCSDNNKIAIEKCPISAPTEVAPVKGEQSCEDSNKRKFEDSVVPAMVVAGESSSGTHKVTIMSNMQWMQYFEVINKKSELPIDKVTEAVECLIEIFHLFGLKRLKRTGSYTAIYDRKEENSLIGTTYYVKGSSIAWSSQNFETWKNFKVEFVKGGLSDIARYNNLILDAIIRALVYVSENGTDSWVKYFKYKTCAYYAKFEEQELPTKLKGLIDNPCYIFGGYIMKWSNILRLREPEKFDSFRLTINMSKMGMPRAEADSIKAAEEATALHLTTEPPPLPKGQMFYNFQGEEVELTKELICDELRRTVREVFMGESYTNELHYSPFFPSTSANYNRTRSKLGAVGEFISEIVQENDLQGECIQIERVECKTRSKFADQFANNGVKQQLFLDEKFLEGQLYNENAVQFDVTEIKAKWKVAMDLLRKEAMFEIPYVDPVGLPEALKIRVISKGPPLLYTFLKPFQKWMWSVLKRNKVFRMIGTPLTEEYVQERIGIPRDDEIIINGDYKASTDNLHSWVSECLADELWLVMRKDENVDKYDFDYAHRELLVRSLIHHLFNVDGQWVDQKEGQLMGSISSFPFLCLANATLCRMALEYSNGKTYRLTDKPSNGSIAPLLINGDDCTLRGNRISLRYNWEKITAFGGLSTSLGKTLFSNISKPVVVLNSQTYYLKNFKWTYIPFVNMGIMLGKARSGEPCLRKFQMLGELFEELKRSAPKFIWKEVCSRFLYYNMKILDECPNIPWNAPTWLGGAGLHDTPMSELDRKVASFIIMRSNEKSFQIKQPIKTDLWRIHELVEDEFREDLRGYRDVRPKRMVNLSKEYLNTDFFNCEEQYSTLYRHKVVEKLFTCNKRQLYGGLNRTIPIPILNAMRMKKNNNVWAKAYSQVVGRELPLLIIREEYELMREKKLNPLVCFEKH